MTLMFIGLLLRELEALKGTKVTSGDDDDSRRVPVQTGISGDVSGCHRVPLRTGLSGDDDESRRVPLRTGLSRDDGGCRSLKRCQVLGENSSHAKLSFGTKLPWEGGSVAISI